MSSLAALMVLVACPTGSTHCISDPVRVISFDQASVCESRLDDEINKANMPGLKIYGTCNRFDPALLTGRGRIDIALDLKTKKTARIDALQPDEPTVGFMPEQ